MKKWEYMLMGLILTINLISCDDSLQEDQEVIGIEEPSDDLVRLESIELKASPEGTPTQTIQLTYSLNGLIDRIEYSGISEIIYELSYSKNNRLISLEQIIGSQETVSDIMYDNNDIVISTKMPDQSIQQRELRIDSQNRIDRSITYNFSTSGIRSEIERKEYIYTGDFNISRINDMAPNSTTILRFTEFTYFFNTNPFRDMNDVTRFLIFGEFIPFTRYLPETQIDYEREGGVFIPRVSTRYSYTLRGDNFPSSREVAITTSTGVETTYEFFNYQP